MIQVNCLWFLTFEDDDGESYSSTVSVPVTVDGQVTPDVEDFISTGLFKTPPDCITYDEETQ